jgi:hypothetical protein
MPLGRGVSRPSGSPMLWQAGRAGAVSYSSIDGFTTKGVPPLMYPAK